MRIVPNNLEAIRTLSHGFSLIAYSKHATVEIPDCVWTTEELVALAKLTITDWDKIGWAYNTHVETYMNSCDLLSEALRQIKPFSQYLRELLMLQARQTLHQ